MEEPLLSIADPFYSSKFGLAWAEDHLTKFDSVIDAFLIPDNYTTAVELDPDGIHNVLKFRLTEPMPYAIDGHVIDIVYNVRAALDQAIFSIATLSGKSPRECYFPITNSNHWLEEALKRKLKNLIPPEICNVIRSFKPYKGGNELIWALHKLCNTSKHGIIRPFPLKSNSGILTGTTAEASGIQILAHPQWNGIDNEMILLRAPLDRNLTMNFDYSFLIIFDDIEGIKGEPVTSILEAFLDEVSHIVTALETETRQLGLI